MTVRRVGMCLTLLASLGLVAWSVGPGLPYPLDGDSYTGIRRLTAYRMIQDGAMRGSLRLPPGARLPSSAIRLRLMGVNESFDLTASTPQNPELQAALERIVGSRHPSYRVALVDLTDPLRPRYAAIRADQGYIPGSVGKLVVMTGLFNELRQRFPSDTAARAALLRNTEVLADKWVIPNSHEVPVGNDAMTSVIHRAIRVGDTFSLWEWVDHMVSPSSNAAGSMVWKHAMLLDAFGSAYPVPVAREDSFFAATPKSALTDRAISVVETPLLAAGIDTAGLRNRTMFTNTAQRIVPGRGSHATPHELVRWLIKLEQGKVVDAWSSREMKKLLYFTRRRYRYAASPALADAAVYFKSGSLYQCQPEAGYTCGKYRGNKMNLMHSVAIVESPAVPKPGETQLFYVISMMSDKPKVNSAAEHQEIATQIERLLRSQHSVTP